MFDTAYNLNCWLPLFEREATAKVAELKHTTLAIARLRFLFLAAKPWRHAGRAGVSYIAITTRSGDCSSAPGIACATSLRERRTLRPWCSFLYDYYMNRA